MITPVQALKIIRTWAAFDMDEKSQMALLPEHVMDLCDAALKCENNKRKKEKK